MTSESLECVSPDADRRPLYVFRLGGEAGGDDGLETSWKPVSDLIIEDLRDLVRELALHGSLLSSMGEGRGVMLSIAAS